MGFLFLFYFSFETNFHHLNQWIDTHKHKHWPNLSIRLRDVHILSQHSNLFTCSYCRWRLNPGNFELTLHFADRNWNTYEYFIPKVEKSSKIQKTARKASANWLNVIQTFTFSDLTNIHLRKHSNQQLDWAVLLPTVRFITFKIRTASFKISGIEKEIKTNKANPNTRPIYLVSEDTNLTRWSLYYWL